MGITVHRTRGCPICGRPIRRQYLMCLQDWRLVPSLLQRDVMNAYGAFKRCSTGDQLRDVLQRLQAAQNAAIAAVTPPEKGSNP